MKLISTCGAILVLISTLARAQSMGIISDAPVTDTLKAVPLQCAWLAQYRSSVEATDPEPGHAWFQATPNSGDAPSMGAPHGQFYIPTPNGKKLLTGIIVLFTAHLADYFVQADMHGWRNPLWKNGVRGAKWGELWDWIPHDGWHIAQMVRNAGYVWGAILIWEAFGDEFAWWFKAANVLVLNVGTRGLGFSLTYRMLQK